MWDYYFHTLFICKILSHKLMMMQCMKAYPLNYLWRLYTVNILTIALRLIHPASPGEDFQLLSEEVTFVVEETTKNVSLVVYDDVWVEFKEKFVIRLIPEDVLLLGSHSTFYIIDNDS